MFTIRPFKRCPKCGETKPATREFWHRGGRQKQMCHQYCRSCSNKTNERRGLPLDERFWSKVDRRGPDDCWPWTGGVGSSGYGQFLVMGRSVTASRIAFELALSPIPEGMCVLHTCAERYPLESLENRRCVNPGHLKLGTHQDNADDKVREGRGCRLAGTSNPCAKLTTDNVLEIRAMRSAGATGRSLALRFGVTESAISLIVLRKAWRHV